MTLWQKSLAWILGVLVALFAAYQVLMYVAFSDMCGNDIWAEYPSPNGQLKAVVFQRDCGATTGFSTQVTILEADNDLPNRAGDILIIEGHPGTVAPAASWSDDIALVLHYRQTGSESLAAKEWTASSIWSPVSVEVKYIP